MTEEQIAALRAAADWRSMDNAPRNASTILLRFPRQGFGRPYVIAAHFAESDGDGEQPPFGPGWFYPVLSRDGRASYMAEIQAKPDAWMPLPDPATVLALLDERGALRAALREIDVMRAATSGVSQAEMAFVMRSIAKAALAGSAAP